jgi:hypothetical protein
VRASATWKEQKVTQERRNKGRRGEEIIKYKKSEKKVKNEKEEKIKERKTRQKGRGNLKKEQKKKRNEHWKEESCTRVETVELTVELR